MPTVNVIPPLPTAALILDEPLVEVPLVPELEELDVAPGAEADADPDVLEPEVEDEKVATGILEMVLQVPPIKMLVYVSLMFSLKGSGTYRSP